MRNERNQRAAKKMTKKKLSVLMAALFAVSMLFSTACGQGRVVFACTDSAEKQMVFEADNAGKGDMVLTGSLEVEEGEGLVIGTALKKGMLKLEFIPSEGKADVGHMPDTDKEALMAAEVSGTETQSYDIPAGSYLVRATVTEKAKGTVTVKVQAEN